MLLGTDNLAYLIDPWEGYKRNIGVDATLGHWPGRLDFTRDVVFERIRWKQWNRSGARGTATMRNYAQAGKGRKARVYFDSPQALTCRSEDSYSDKVTIVLYQRFGWTEGFKHVRSDERWLTVNEWLLLDRPNYVLRGGTLYAC